MQLTALSKAARSIGVMVLLSVMVGTPLQQSAHAQSKVPTLEDGTCAPLPQGTVYQEFGGITFSPAQKAAYRRSAAKIEKRMKAITSAPTPVDNPDRSVNIVFNEGIGDKKASEIGEMVDTLTRDKVPGDKIVELVNKKYGRYAKVAITQYAVFSPEQIAAGQQAGLDFEAEMMSVFTPEQQKTYRANLAVQRRIQACVPADPNAKIISPLPF